MTEPLLDTEALAAVASQLMTAKAVSVGGKSSAVKRTSSSHLKTAAFTLGGREYQAIEQNPDKPSQWGQLARQGHQVVQFKDVETNRFVAVAVDGKVKQYGAMKHEK